MQHFESEGKNTFNPKVKFVKPILDVVTRWNSTVEMLERACHLKRALVILFAEMAENARHDESFTFDANEWKVYENFRQFLSIFKTATKMASVDKYPSLSLVVPLYNTLLDHTESVCVDPNSSQDLRDAAAACKAKLIAYYNVTSDACTIATVLDPRLKLEYYRPDNDEAGHVRVNEIFTMVNEAFSKHYGRIEAEETAETSTGDGTRTGDHFSDRIFKKRKISAVSEFKEYCESVLADESLSRHSRVGHYF